MRCFEDTRSLDQFDQAAFKFKHKLMGHPALSLENIGRVLPTFPKKQVMYSQGFLQNGDDFETAYRERPAQSIEQTIENIRVSDSFIMVQAPESDPSFAPIHRELLADVEDLMRRLGLGRQAVEPHMWLFIASPNSVTPFHIDRYSTFLMQFRGSKQVSVFPQWDERVISSAHRESYMAYANTRLPWHPEMNAMGETFEFQPGEAIHIPFVAGHHVRNGSEDVSISMSIIFNTAQTMAWRQALSFNHSSRRVLKRFGLTPTPVGKRPLRDATKSTLWRAVRHVKGALA